jgi:WD40 repeat protein
LFQQAANQPDGTAPAQMAAERARLGCEDRPWLRHVNKPKTLDPCLMTLVGPRKTVTACGCAPDGTRLVSAAEDFTLTIWDQIAGAELATMRGHVGPIRGCCFSPDGSRIVSASEDETLRVWDARTGADIATLRGHTSGVAACAYSPDGTRIVSAAWKDKALKVWDAATGAEVLTVEGHTAPARVCAFSPDGTRVVSAGMDRTVRHWDAVTGKEIVCLRISDDPMAISGDGTRVVTERGIGYRDAQVWDAVTGRRLSRLRIGQFPRAFAFSADGARVAVASVYEGVQVFEANGDGTPAFERRGRTVEVSAVAFSPDGTYLVDGAKDGTLKVWDVTTDAEVFPYAGPVKTCLWFWDGTHVVSSTGGRISVWSLATGDVVRTIDASTSEVSECALSPDGTHLASASSDGLKVWNVSTGTESARLHALQVASCAFSADGTRIAFTSEDRTVHARTLHLWDTATGVEVAGVPLGIAEQKLAMSPDGGRAVAFGSQGLKLFDIVTGTEVAVLEGHVSLTRVCAFSPDGSYVASASEQGLKLWDAIAGGELAGLRHPLGYAITAWAFSPDGKRIVSASHDGRMPVWDIATRTFVAFPFHGNQVQACAFSPDGARLASVSSWNSTLNVWDASTWAATLELRVPGLAGAAWSPDGGHLVCWSSLGDVALLKLENLTPGPILVTPYRLASGEHDDSVVHFGCPHCRKWGNAPATALGSQIDCPACGKPLKLSGLCINADWRPFAKAWKPIANQ